MYCKDDGNIVLSLCPYIAKMSYLCFQVQADNDCPPALLA